MLSRLGVMVPVHHCSASTMLGTAAPLTGDTGIFTLDGKTIVQACAASCVLTSALAQPFFRHV